MTPRPYVYSSDYSKAEFKLLRAISPKWLHLVCQTEINPPKLYQILAEEAFIENQSGPEFDALRRCCKAVRDCDPYRMTPEFDKLCEF